MYKSRLFFLLAASGSELRLVMECSEADGFHILQVTDERERLEDDKVTKYKSLGPNDLLLLSKEEVSLYLFDNSFILSYLNVGFSVRALTFFFFFQVKGSSFPSSYGFAVVENRQSNLLRLRMYLAEEVVQITKNTRYSRTNPFIQSLSNMRSLITSSASLLDKRVLTLKVSCYDTSRTLSS